MDAVATLSVGLGQHSDAGRKPENQDFFGAILPKGRTLAMKGVALAIADGISTSPVSAQAAQTAIKSFLEDYYATPEPWSVETSGRKVVQSINAWLFQENMRTGGPDQNHGLVTTFTALIFKGREAHVFHVGDGRAYRFAEGSLKQLTRDHRFNPSPGESYLSRALGIDETVEVDYQAVRIDIGDVFMLSTDGVHDHLSPDALKMGLSSASGPWDRVAQTLVSQALEAGSDDNLTLQIAEVTSLAPETGADFLSSGRDLSVPKALKAGDRIDGLTVLRQIYSSSRSCVYLVANEAQQRFALKVPSSESAESSGYVQRFLLEEWIARRIDSDHVLAAAAPPVERSALYVLTPYFEGQTLRQWMADNPAPDIQQVRAILEQIVRGVRAFHRKDMLHQDLRPENILIDTQGTVKIIDFGSVYVPGVEEAAPGTAGLMPGTFQYTAPEYLSGDAVSWRSDQFAVGVMAYEMLTGQLPYGTAVAKVARRSDQRRLRYTPAREHNPAVPLWLDAAIKRAVHPDPLKRFDALSEFVKDICEPRPVDRLARHVPLAQSSPVQFWQAICAVLSLIILWLLYELTA